MIYNLTAAEWDALVSAVALQDVEWEQNGDHYGHSARRQRDALRRALDKARQLAPADS